MALVRARLLILTCSMNVAREGGASLSISVMACSKRVFATPSPIHVSKLFSVNEDGIDQPNSLTALPVY